MTDEPMPCGSKGCNRPRRRYSTGNYSVQCTECGRAAKAKSRRKAGPMLRLSIALDGAREALNELKAVS